MDKNPESFNQRPAALPDKELIERLKEVKRDPARAGEGTDMLEAWMRANEFKKGDPFEDKLEYIRRLATIYFEIGDIFNALLAIRHADFTSQSSDLSSEEKARAKKFFTEEFKRFAALTDIKKDVVAMEEGRVKPKIQDF